MTLVVVLQSKGIPAIFGDLMISGGLAKATRKKIVRLRKNLIVGWAGSEKRAEWAFQELDGSIGQNPSLEEFRTAVLTHSCRGYELPLSLAGWVLGQPDVAFHWSSEQASDFSCGKEFAIGSGEAIFRKNIGFGSTANSTASPEVELLDKVGNLIKSDLTTKENQLFEKFGVSYDIFIARNGRFRPISPTVYYAMNVQLTSALRIKKTVPLGPLLLHRNIGELSVYQVGDTSGITIDLVTPVFGGPRTKRLESFLMVWIRKEQNRIRYNGKYAFIYVAFIDSEGKGWPPYIITTPRGYAWRSSDRIGISISKSILESHAKLIGKDLGYSVD